METGLLNVYAMQRFNSSGSAAGESPMLYSSCRRMQCNRKGGRSTCAPGNGSSLAMTLLLHPRAAVVLASYVLQFIIGIFIIRVHHGFLCSIPCSAAMRP